MKIKSLITVFGCILVSAAVFILGLCTSLVSYFSSIETVNNDLKSTTEYYSMLVKEKLELMRFQMEFSSRDQNLVNIRKSTTDRLTYLSDAAALTDYKNFKVAFSTGITYEDEDVSTEKFFLKSENEKLTYVTKPQVREDGSLTYIYSMYIAGFYHEFDLVLFGELPYSTIGSLISGTQIGSTGNGFIVDEDGTIIFHNDKDLVKNSTNYITMAQTDSKYANIAQSFEKMVARETGTDTISLDGTSYYLSYIPIEGAENWSYAVMVPVNEMMSSFYNSLMITFIVLIIMVVIGAITSIIVANRLSEPIVDVASRLELLAEGDLKTTLELTDSNTQEINRLYRSINKTLNRLNAYITDISRVLSSLANHDLTIKPEVVYSGDFSSINTSLVMICSSLNDIFGTLDSVSSDISSGSIVIADSSHNLAQSTKEQSENITALTASVDSITYQIKDTVEHTAEAHEITNLAVNFVDRGTERMKAMTHSMDKISESSNTIKKIAKTIEDIAFQTNILALNAAVEAARAGEAGKGFAVVADEVKNLASKSAEAAKTTSSLIKNTLDAIEKGTSRAEQASDSLKSITQQVEKVQDIIMNIKSAAVVESDSIDSVKHNLENINKATLTTSTASIESADASTKFSGDANTLSNIVKNFKLDYVDEKRIEIFRAHIEHNNLLSSAAIDKQLSNTNGENDDTEDPITDTAPQLENVEAPAESDTEKQLSEPEKPKDTEKDEKPAAEKASERRKFFEKRKAETTKNNKSSDKSKSVKENAKTSKSDKASKGNKPADNVKPNKSDKAANESKPADNAESVKTDKDANENKPADNTKSVKTDKVANESKPADNTKSVKTDKAAQENKAADNAKPDGKSKIEAKHETKEPEIARTEPVVRNTKITDITKNDDKY